MEDCRWTGLADPRGLRRLLLVGCAALPLLSQNAGAAGTLPSGGHFVAGAGGIASSGTTTTVTQSSRRGIVDWKSFSIGKGDKVQFNNGSGATLNRVTGGSLSTIAGRLNATGSVYLINRNGVVVAPGGKVVTGGNFVASTRDVTNGQFMAGGAQTFTGASNGVVVNDGAVVSEGGSVVLIGHAATNSGSIDAAKGTATLASGNKVLMTDANGPERVYVAKGKSGDTTNDGQIRAAAVELAAAGGNVYALAGNRDGLIRATGTATVNGQVWLTSREGTVDVAGRVVAKEADGTGGTIMAKGAALKIENRAVLNAAGKTGKGRIATSGHDVSIGKARVTGGQKGKWTIDPTDLTINSSAAGTISATLNAGTDVTEQTTATTASGAGGTSSGNGDITVASAITWSTSAQLTLSAFHSIDVNAAVTVSGGGTLVLTYNNGQGGASSGGALTFLMGQGSAQFTAQASNPSLFINDGTPGIGNGTQYTLIYNTGNGARGLQSLDGSSGNFALAVPLDATGLGTVGHALIPSFGGNFNGLGNTVSNLTINGTSACPFGTCSGMFATLGAGSVVANFGLVHVSVTDAAFAALDGGLVGESDGSIVNSYATGTVTGGFNGGTTGGLAGVGSGAIANSYFSGTVAGGGVSGGALGGLVGVLNGSVTNSYASGSVSTPVNASVGGLIGAGNPGSVVSNSYSTSSVSGGPGSDVGGFMGDTNSTITNCYWNTATSGTNIGIPVGSLTTGTPTGLTTAQLSAALPAGFSPAIWANAGNRTTPYLSGNPGPVYVGSDTFVSTLVFTPAQLQAISTNLSGNYALAGNINMSGVAGFAPIGDGITPYTGTFNGLGFTINNLTITTNATLGGLFGKVGVGGTVENIGLVGGGITDLLTGGTVGALVGENAGTVTNVYATGTVTGGAFSDFVGGLIGTNDAILTNSYATGSVSGGFGIGGLVGYNNGGTISGAYASGAVQTPSTADAGGLVGDNGGGTITQSYATGSVTGGNTTGSVGGLVGRNVASGVISNVYATGAVTGSGLIGGLAGQNNDVSTITDAYATGAATSTTGGSFVGGLAGFNAPGASITRVYATGKITLGGGLDLGGGLVGDNAGTINAGFFNADRAGTTAGIGLALSGSTATALSGSQPFNTASYAGFAFTATPGATGNAWVMVDPDGTLNGSGGTMPMLAFEYSTNIRNAHQLQLMAMDRTANYTLAQNIDASGTNATATAGADIWGPSGFSSVASLSAYTGTFDGAGHTISGLTIRLNDSQFVGLFGQTSGATIKNVTLTGGSVSAGVDSIAVGGLVGMSTNSTITFVSDSATVSSLGSSNVGGLVGGTITGGTISNSSATGSVTAANAAAVGGLVGQALSAGGALTMANDSASGAVIGTNAVGGLVGDSHANITGGTATGNVTGSTQVGGLVGVASQFIASSTATGAVTGTGALAIAGGLTGQNSGIINGSSATGTVTATTGGSGIPSGGPTIGGLAGISTGAIGTSTASGAVTAGTDSNGVGGLIGQNTGTVNQSSSSSAVTAGTGGQNIGGLIGRSAGAVDQSFSTGAVNAAASSAIGGLVGLNINGTISQSYSTGSVTGTGSSTQVGGLVGSASHAGISKSFASGLVTGATRVGGLVGVLDTSTITQSYSVSSVTASGSLEGGLVGSSIGGSAINEVFAVGAVSGAATVGVGGLVGQSLGGSTVFSGYWDRGTTGQSTSAGGTGMTTGQLQAALPSGFTGGVWGIVANKSYPYLAFQFVGTPQVVTGTVYLDNGATHAGAGGTVNAVTPGAAINSVYGGVTTFANGYYYYLVSPGTIAPGSSVLTYAQYGSGGSIRGAAFADAVNNTATGLAIYGNTLHEITATTTNSVLQGNLATAEAGFGPVTAFVNGLANLRIDASGAFTVDSAISYGTGRVTLVAGGALSQSGGATITANVLTGRAVGGVDLTAGNQVATLGAFTNSAGNFSFTDARSLATAGTIASAGNITLTTAGVNSSLTLGGSLTATGATVTLTTTGAISQTGGIITAGTLTGTAAGDVTLNKDNKVGRFDFGTSGGGSDDISFTDTVALTLASGFATNDMTVTTRNGAGITLTGTVQASRNLTLNSAGTITETGAGLIQTGGQFSGRSVGGATLNGNNLAAAFQGFTNTVSGNIGFTNTAVNAAYGGLTTQGDLTLTGPGMVLAGNLTAGAGKTVTLVSTGGIAQVSGIIAAKTLTGSSTNATVLGGANRIDNLTAFTAGGALSLTDAVALTTTGSIVAGNGGSGDLSLTATSLTLTGNGTTWAVSTPGAMTLTTTTGAIGLGAFVSATGTMTLNSAGSITENAGTGGVTAGTLTGGSVGGTSLTSVAVATLGNFANTGSGNLSIADTVGALSVSGAVSTANGTTLSLAYAGTLSLTAASSLSAGSAGIVTLGQAGSGSISQAAGSVITAGTLQGQANGGVSLGGANQVAVLGSFSNGTSGDFDFADARSFGTVGTISSFGSLTFSAGTGDSLTVGGALTAGGNVNLNMRGAITQSAGSVITAVTLTGSSVGGATLTGANLVDNLGPFADTGAGNATGFSFTDAQALLTIGTVRSTGQLTLTTTSGNLTLDSDVNAPGGAVTLNSAGGITQLGGAIDPGSLLINSVGSVSLTGANTVDTIAGRVTGAGATLTFNDTANHLTIGTVGGVSGVRTNNGDITLRTTTSGDMAINRAVDAGTGTVTIATPGDLSIGAGGSVSAGAGATLATLGNFTNAGSANAITVGAGSHWLVYSSDPNADADGGLKPDFIQYAATYTVGTLSGSAPKGSGNGFLYSLTPAALTVTGVTKTYDGTTGLSGAAYTASGAVAGDVVALGGSPTGSFASKHAGAGIDVTVSGLTVTASRNGIAVYGYTVAAITNDPIGTIGKATLTAGLTGTVRKAYDGTTVARLTSGNYTLTGVIAGDAVRLNNPSTGTYASAEPGTGITVTVGGLALVGAGAGDYQLATTTVQADIGNIAPRSVRPPPPPPPPPPVVLPPDQFIPVQPPQPPQSDGGGAAAAADAAHSLVVPKPDLAEMVKLSGCTSGDFIAVVPGEDGHVGAVVVEAEGNKTVLHAAYAGCSGSKPVITSPQEVNASFGGALSARPPAPVNFVLYFNSGTASLAAQAQAVFGQAVAQIAARKPVDVVVTGFTDSTGTPQANDLLSMARARTVTKLLVARGLPPDAIATFGRGARDPQVPTPEHVAEEKNRRVEITVR